MADQPVSNEAQPKKSNKISLAILIFLILVLIGFITVYIRERKEIKTAQRLATAQTYINQGKFSDAILELNKVIANNPNDAEAYSLRATAYELSRSNVFTEQQDYFVSSLHDLDKLIELQPTNGNNYVVRNFIFRELASMAKDSATEFALYELANDNAEKAIQLGVSPDYSYIYRHHASNLIKANHCKQGLQETEDLLNQSKPGDPNIDYYNMYQTEAYICLGDLNKALETAQLIQCDGPLASCRSMYLVEIYFQSGESQKALDLINQMIDSEPTYGAWRYFIRALIYYERGEKELALQDLTTGDNYSWFSNGVYWYVKAKLAFDEGDHENGMLYLQYAESTLDVQYTPFR